MIAIENTRLFEEVQARTRELTESLEQQTATSEVLSVISRSPIDVQPVFDTMLDNALRLCGADRTCVFRFDGDGHSARRTAQPAGARRASRQSTRIPLEPDQRASPAARCSTGRSFTSPTY